MHSTDLDAVLGALFDEVLMPISTHMHSEGEQAFPLRPDVSWLSYYVRRRRSVAVADDLDGASCASPAEFGARLAAHWQRMGRHALLPQVQHFAHAALLARAACAERPAAPSLSPYVYAMF